MTSKELSQDSKADKSQQLKRKRRISKGRTASKRKSVEFAKIKFCIVFRVRESEN